MTQRTDALTLPTHVEVAFWRLWQAAGIDHGATIAHAIETMLVWADDDPEQCDATLACRQVRNALRDGRTVVFRLELDARHGTVRDRRKRKQTPPTVAP